MTQLLSVTNPRYSTKDGSLIDVTVLTKEYGTVDLSLHAGDKVMYGYGSGAASNGDLFEFAQRGIFGAIKPYGG